MTKDQFKGIAERLDTIVELLYTLTDKKETKVEDAPSTDLPVTEKQQKFIYAIEEALDKIFSGTTKVHATKFIKEWAEKMPKKAHHA